LLKTPKAYFKVKLIYLKHLKDITMDNQQEINFIYSLETIRLTLKFIKLCWRYSPVLVEKPRVKGKLSTNRFIIYNTYY